MSLRIAAATMGLLSFLGILTAFVDDTTTRVILLSTLNAAMVYLTMRVWKHVGAWTLRTIVRGEKDGTLDTILSEFEKQVHAPRVSITPIAADGQPNQQGSR
jgi:hypothetical protein